MARLLRAPLLHFLLIGGALLGLRTWWRPEGSLAIRPRIVIGRADLARLREGWAEEHGAPPGRAAELALVRDAVEEEILYREALARGFDRQDETVRERLVRLGGFVGEETGDRNSLERAARRLGLERSDLVIRRHLVEMMRLATGWLGRDGQPSEADLATYCAEHAAEFAPPVRIRLTHVYLSEDRRGAGVAADAARLLDDLRRTRTRPEVVGARGDAGRRHGADGSLAR